MGRNHEEGHFSSEQIKIGMDLQRLDRPGVVGNVYRAARDWWSGSESRAYVPVTWAPVDMLVNYGADAKPVDVVGDPEAGLRPRTWRRSVIVGAGMTALQEIKDVFGGHGVPAVGYQSDDINYAAELPNGFGELEGDYHIPGVVEDGKALAAALRQGRKPGAVMLGIAYPEKGRLVIPPQAIIQELAVNVSLPARFPGVPLV